MARMDELRETVEELSSRIEELEAEETELRERRAPVARRLAMDLIHEVLPDAAVVIWVIMAPRRADEYRISWADVSRIKNAQMEEIYHNKPIPHPESKQPTYVAQLLTPKLWLLREILWADLEINFEFDDGFTMTEVSGELHTEVSLSYKR